VRFRNKSYLYRALVHRSFANESHIPIRDNERLEYLGDSVLALVINEYLFKHFEDYHEGDLAKIKSAVVSEDMLVKIARELDIGAYVLLGKGEENSGGRNRESILANTVEAVIGAMFLDCGLKKTKNFILSLFKKHIDQIDRLPSLRDPKTTLQEIVQKKYKSKPEYVLIKESGPDHKKKFTVQLVVNNIKIQQAIGSSKRKAEIEAAMKTLKLINQGKIKI
jgi:ribonuclease-3